MNPLTHLRIKVHDFVLSSFLKKGGWALVSPGPLPAQRHVVMSSKKLSRLLKEGDAELWFEKKAWERAVAEYDGSAKAKKQQSQSLKKERNAKAKLLEKTAKDAKEKAAEAQRLVATDAQKAAQLAKIVDQRRQEAAKLQNDVALLQKQIDAMK